MKPRLFEITSSAKFEPSISTAELAKAFLPPSEWEACLKEQTQIKLMGTITFTAHSKLVDAILNICKPESLENGDVQFSKRTYFRWSQAKPRIIRIYGLTDINYIGRRGNVTGIRISSMVSDDKAHRKKYVSMIRTFKQKYPHIRVVWENCLHTVACDVEDIKAFQQVLDKKEGQSK